MIRFQVFSIFFLLFLTSLTFAENRVGAMAELSGPMARTGEDCRKGYRVAENEFRKGHPGKKKKDRRIFWKKIQPSRNQLSLIVR